MMSSNRIVLAIVAIGCFLIILGLSTIGVIGGLGPPGPDFPDFPDKEYNVTCYKWVENGTAKVLCPDKVYAPDAWVNITVEPCDAYVIKIDETVPCGGSA